ncbi:MAG: hypothetical protein IK005_12850 [Paludibacteraceae bacterium]|nr:hypothetical protein [Paludibacteraceae bacterium]
MKKVFLLIGCLALLASCGKKKAQQEEVTQPETEVVTEAAPVEEVAADPFPASESYPAKTDGFREADGVWTLYLIDAVNGANKLEILSDAVVVLADNSEKALADLDKTALNEKSTSIWLKDGKVSHIKVNE